MANPFSCPPVLLLAFNRPDTTKQVLAAIRRARPRSVFFAVDGPRPNVSGDGERVEEVRALLKDIDWDCDTKTLFRPSNKGCKLGISEAITWFFDQVEAGVIMEDDCVPDLSFFRFAAELLEKYANNERVFLISGDNFQNSPRTEVSYYFSRYAHIWGWASWRRAWRHYDHTMSAWPKLRDSGWLRDVLGDRKAADYWTRIFEDTYMERNSSWGYRWMFSCWANNALAILPSVNLVSNIGFGNQATHTSARESRFAFMRTEEMRFPLKHPPTVNRDAAADRFTQKSVFGKPSLFSRAIGKVRALLRRAG